jgi:membrane protease YdiL (CAAX protease family)
VSLPLVFVASLLTSPLLEEPGWRGFALPHLQDRLTALAAGVLLGFVEGCGSCRSRWPAASRCWRTSWA